jgi:TrmH family RNA methyltransferase
MKTFKQLPEPDRTLFFDLLSVANGKSGDACILLEGRRLVADVLESKTGAECVIFSDDERGRQLEETLGALLPGGLSRFRLRRQHFLRLSDTKTPQGVLILTKLPERPLRADCPPASFPWLVLDEISDPGNAGTLLRSAEAFGFPTVVRIGGAKFRQGKVVRASMGAALRLGLYEAASPGILLETVKKNGVKLFVADLEGQSPRVADLSGKKNALLISSEAHGVSEAFRGIRDRLSIPMAGGESLNAGVAGSILMYEMSNSLCKL